MYMVVPQLRTIVLAYKFFHPSKDGVISKDEMTEENTRIQLPGVFLFIAHLL